MSNDVLAKVQQILQELFNADPYSVFLNTRASDIPEWDSVGHLSPCGALEEAFEMRFGVGDFAEIDNVRAIVSLVETKRRLLAV